MATDDVTATLASKLAEALPGELITKWVVLAEVIDDHGERALYSLAQQDMRAWDTLGLLTFALHKEQAASVLEMQEGD